MPLVLRRKCDETVIIDLREWDLGVIEVGVIEVGIGDTTRNGTALTFRADRRIPIHRNEVYMRSRNNDGNPAA